MKPNNAPPRAPKQRSVLLLVLALSLTACASSSPPAPVLTLLPARPPLSEPPPLQPYSERVRTLLSSWADLLTPTQPTR